MQIEELLGRTFTKVYNDRDEKLIFEGEKSFYFYHYPDCCEQVEIVDICGDLSDLENSPILQAEENSSPDELNENDISSEDFAFCKGYEKDRSTESRTWTFYRFATIKGSVVVRWFGRSNGYYSERVSFDEM